MARRGIGYRNPDIGADLATQTGRISSGISDLGPKLAARDPLGAGPPPAASMDWSAAQDPMTGQAGIGAYSGGGGYAQGGQVTQSSRAPYVGSVGGGLAAARPQLERMRARVNAMNTVGANTPMTLPQATGYIGDQQNAMLDAAQRTGFADGGSVDPMNSGLTTGRDLTRAYNAGEYPKDTGDDLADNPAKYTNQRVLWKGPLVYAGGGPVDPNEAIGKTKYNVGQDPFDLTNRKELMAISRPADSTGADQGDNMARGGPVGYEYGGVVDTLANPNRYTGKGPQKGEAEEKSGAGMLPHVAALSDTAELMGRNATVLPQYGSADGSNGLARGGPVLPTGYTPFNQALVARRKYSPKMVGYQQGGPIRPNLAGYMAGAHALPAHHLDAHIQRTAAANPGLDEDAVHVKAITDPARAGDHVMASAVMAGLRKRYNRLNAHAQGAAAHHDLVTAAQFADAAHSHMPDGRKVQHFVDGGGVTVKVRPGGDHRLTHRQFHDYLVGPGTDFDHQMDNGVEKNLRIASSVRHAPTGYQEGGEVDDDNYVPENAMPYQTVGEVSPSRRPTLDEARAQKAEAEAGYTSGPQTTESGARTKKFGAEAGKTGQETEILRWSPEGRAADIAKRQAQIADAYNASRPQAQSQSLPIGRGMRGMDPETGLIVDERGTPYKVENGRMVPGQQGISATEVTADPRGTGYGVGPVSQTLDDTSIPAAARPTEGQLDPAIRATLDRDRADYGLTEKAAGTLGARGVPIGPDAGGAPADITEAIRPGGGIEQGVAGRHAAIKDVLKRYITGEEPAAAPAAAAAPTTTGGGPSDKVERIPTTTEGGNAAPGITDLTGGAPVQPGQSAGPGPTIEDYRAGRIPGLQPVRGGDIEDTTRFQGTPTTEQLQRGPAAAARPDPNRAAYDAAAARGDIYTTPSWSWDRLTKEALPDIAKGRLFGRPNVVNYPEQPAPAPQAGTTLATQGPRGEPLTTPGRANVSPEEQRRRDEWYGKEGSPLYDPNYRRSQPPDPAQQRQADLQREEDKLNFRAATERNPQTAQELLRQAHDIRRARLQINRDLTRGGVDPQNAVDTHMINLYNHQHTEMVKYMNANSITDPAQVPEGFRVNPQLQRMMDDYYSRRVPAGRQPAAGTPAAGGQPATGPIRVNSMAEAQKLPRGTQFIDPNGVLRTVP